MSHREKDFFVGYLPMSPGLRRSTAVLAAVLCTIVLLAGVGWSMLHGDPGESLEPIGDQPEIRGVFRARPYPHVVQATATGSSTLLLVGSGKGGARIGELDDGQGVRVSGTLLTRDGTRIVEGPDLAPAELSPEIRDSLTVSGPEPRAVTLTGEIVDSKCYFGRMRPGGGRVHRACAQICIEGGVPPILVVRNADGQEQHVVLASEDGGPCNEDVLPFVAEPVRVRGTLHRVSGLDWLWIDPADIERL
ncbi:MAG: hypothetical protein RL885_15150 [Planctomycetota bacterium]